MWIAKWRGNAKHPGGSTAHDTEAEAERVAARKLKAIGWLPGMPAPEVVVYEVPDCEESA
jgi:hypothetical protein